MAGRSLEYFDMEANEKIVDGEERARLLRHSVSQDTMWHGAAQTTAAVRTAPAWVLPLL